MSRTTGLILAGVAIAGLAVGLVWQPWAAVADPGRDPFAAGRPPGPDTPDTPGERTPMARDQFGQDRAGPPAAAAVPIPFDGDRAMTYLKDLCAIGPRVSGTPGMKTQQRLVTAHFEKLGAKVTRQEFEARQTSRREPVEMVNLTAAWHPDRAGGSSSVPTTTPARWPTRSRNGSTGASRSSAPTTAPPGSPS